MSNRLVELAIEIASRASTAGMDATVDAARTMRDQVESAASSSATALDRVSSASENLDDKAGRATGALGALSSGFELVGLSQYAEGLNAVAMATDFASGVGQALGLVMELEVVQRAKAVVVAGAHTAATLAQSAAAKTAAAAQAVLNAVLAANPVALVVLAVVALVAILVLAYKRSETFRDIVQGAMAVARAAVSGVIDVITSLVGWITGRASAAWSVLRDAVTVTIATVREKITSIRETAQEIFGKVQDIVGGVMDTIGDKIESFKTGAKTAFEALMTPINAIRDAIQAVIDKIAAIKLPKVDLNPFDGRANSPTLVPGFGGGGGSTFTLELNVTPSPLSDPNAIAAAIVAAINDYLVRMGITPVVV